MKCTYDPSLLKGLPLGMFHCPECGDMVIAGLPHYDYTVIDEPPMYEEMDKEQP